MRIAIIHPYLNARGGSQRYVIEIANTLKNLGVEVDVYAYEFNKEKCYPELTKNLNIIHKTSSNEDSSFIKRGSQNSSGSKEKLKKVIKNKIFSRIYYELAIDYLYSEFRVNKQANELEKLISSGHSCRKYDLIFSHEEPFSLYAAIKFKIKHDVPVYWFCYDTILKWFLEWNPVHSQTVLRSFILKNFFFLVDKYKVRKHVDLIAVLDTKMQDRIKKFYNRDAVLRRGALSATVFNFKRENFVTNRFRKENKKISICLVSRFVEYRRLIDIFDLIRILPLHIDEHVQFYINAPVTDNEYYQYCKKTYTDIFQKENVVIDITPFLSDNEMYGVYFSSDIFIFPNEKQTWGHAPLEAMACSCMAIVSEGCGIHEIVKSISDTTYKAGDIQSLLRILTTVVENETYAKIGAIQRKYVEDNLTWPKICSEFINDFNSIINV